MKNALLGAHRATKPGKLLEKDLAGLGGLEKRRVIIKNTNTAVFGASVYGDVRYLRFIRYIRYIRFI